MRQTQTMNITILSLGNQTETDAIRLALLGAGHDCVVRGSTKALLEGLRSETCELLVLGASDSYAETAELVSAAKLGTKGVMPVLLLIDSAAILADDVINFQAIGVDDYLVLPIRRTDLLMRVDVLLRRVWPDKMDQAQLRVGPFVFDMMSHSVRRDGKRIELTQKEFELALLFFRHLNQPLSRVTLQETIWARDWDIPSRTVDTHVSRVRNKLSLQDGGQFSLIPVYAYGYVLEEAAGGK
jgi:DNA-binding response OmpR family regulator